jgi:acyl carrier protein
MEVSRIEDLIIFSLKEMQEELEEPKVVPINTDTKIFGRQGLLDSNGLVSLIVELEEKIEDEFGVSLILADERAMSQKKSPFKSVLSLAQYICMLIDEEKAYEGT